MELHITSLHFDADQKLLDYIDKKAGKLSQFSDRIIDAHVILKLENTGQVRQKIFEMKLNVPGDTLIATERATSFEAAADLGVDNMKRQLVRYKERQRIRQ